MTIDHLSGTPVYMQLAGLLRARIERGELAPDRPLPSYTTLMQEHDVARGTAAKAVQVLVAEGLVKIVPGRGAYVTRLDERPLQSVTRPESPSGTFEWDVCSNCRRG